MKIAILSDVHANREALQEVENTLADLDIDEVLFLGDAVGYNADPDYCVRRMKAITGTVVRGNHDKTVADPQNLEWFNEFARQAILWTRNALSMQSLELLAAYPAGPREISERLLICHGSPMDEDLYITGRSDVARSFSFMSSRYPQVRICFFGHTHVPLIVEENGRALMPPERYSLDPGRRYLINPGSVGQPRDGVPLASFGVLDEERMTFRHYRVPFPIEATQRKIIAAGLPRMLADRLAVGR
jgi:predicted phosphodiesterase